VGRLSSFPDRLRHGHSDVAVPSGLHRPRPQTVMPAATHSAGVFLRAGGVAWATRRRRGRWSPRSRNRREGLLRKGNAIEHELVLGDGMERPLLGDRRFHSRHLR
jgi:hypothetical protein